MTVTSKWVALHEVSDYLAKGWREVQIIGGCDNASLMVSPEEPAQPEPVAPEMPEAVYLAVNALRQESQYWAQNGVEVASNIFALRADALETFWRIHAAQPAKVRMTPELENLLKLADYAEVAMRTGFNPPYLLMHNELRAAIKVVREKFQ